MAKKNRSILTSYSYHEVEALRQEAVDTVVGVVTEVAMAINHRSNIPLC